MTSPRARRRQLRKAQAALAAIVIPPPPVPAPEGPLDEALTALASLRVEMDAPPPPPPRSCDNCVHALRTYDYAAPGGRRQVSRCLLHASPAPGTACVKHATVDEFYDGSPQLRPDMLAAAGATCCVGCHYCQRGPGLRHRCSAVLSGRRAQVASGDSNEREWYYTCDTKRGRRRR